MKINISAHMIIVLTAVCLFSGVSLVYMNQYAEPLIEENAKKATEKAIYKVFMGVTDVEKMEYEDRAIFKGFDEEGKIVGYAFVAEGSGYQGIIRIMIGVDVEFEKLIAIDILESVETPGLGAKIVEDDFKNQFKGISVSPQIEYVKGKEPEKPNEIQAITGATISSVSVVNILNTAIEEITEIFEEIEKSEEEDEDE